MKTKRELGGEFKAYIILHIMASGNEKRGLYEVLSVRGLWLTACQGCGR